MGFWENVIDFDPFDPLCHYSWYFLVPLFEQPNVAGANKARAEAWSGLDLSFLGWKGRFMQQKQGKTSRI